MKTFEKHTKNYMDAMWVVENPEKYDNRDVARANSFIEAYNEGYNKALSLPAIVEQSEQLVCPRCRSTNCIIFLKENEAECNDCGFIWAG